VLQVGNDAVVIYPGTGDHEIGAEIEEDIGENVLLDEVLKLRLA